jgi:hypothetical protein
MELEVGELCQSESGTVNEVFAKKLLDPQNLLSICYLLADQVVLLLL